MDHNEKTMDKIVAFCKNRGFVYAGSEIYGGLANTWDYGPLGVEFKNNVKKAWLKKFVQESPYNVGLDAAIIMNPQTWVTTGHVVELFRPSARLQGLHSARHRADKLIGEEHHEVDVDAVGLRGRWTAFVAEHEDIICPVCGKHNFTAHPQVQPHVQNRHRRYRGALPRPAICARRPRRAFSSTSQNIQRTTRRKAPVRRLPGRQGVPQRDHPGQLHVPHARV